MGCMARAYLETVDHFASHVLSLTGGTYRPSRPPPLATYNIGGLFTAKSI